MLTTGSVRSLREGPATSRASARRPFPARFVPPVIVALIVFSVAFENGGYGLTARTFLAIGIWWAIILAVGFGFVPRAPVGRMTVTVAALLAAFALWTLLSALWAPSAESAFAEFNRASLYLGVFLLAALAVGRASGRLLDGLTIGIVAVALVALASRLFPHLFSSRQMDIFLPYSASRLSFPVGYWNGLAILTALALPLCLRSALIARTPIWRAASIGLMPMLSAVIYLASSRGGAVTAVVGIVAFLAATARRWSAFVVTVLAAFSSAVAVAVLVRQPVLVNGPVQSAAATSEGRTAALLLVLLSVATGALLLGGERALAGRVPTPSRRVGWSIVATAGIGAIALVILAHPVRRFDAFRQPLAAGQVASSNFATAHLLSGNGSGRWQFWSAAINEFESAPLIGRGAASYQYWWEQHASFTYFLKNAHSLYLETLGELGLIGLGLLAAAFGVGVISAVQRVRATTGEERVTLAALFGVVIAFLIAAGIDWMWQLTIVAVIGIAALGLISGSARAAPLEPAHPTRGPRRVPRMAVGISVIALAWGIICAQAVPWLADAKVSDSQAAVRRGDLAAAATAAADARSLEPWASSPYLQLALVAEQRGDLADATRWVASAIQRSPSDWSIWYVASRIQAKDGLRAAATRSYAKAAALNPRSPLFGPPR